MSPQHREIAGLEHEDPVAGRERVRKRRFPGAGAGRWKDHNRRGGLEHALEAVEHLAAETRERGAAVIDGRLCHRAQHAVGHVGRSGDL